MMTVSRTRSVCMLACVGSLAAVFAGQVSPHPAGSAPKRLTRLGVVHTMPAAEAAASDGAELYDQNCAACHQATGGGVPGAFPPLAGNKLVQGDAHFLSRVVLYGLQGRVTVNGHTYNGVSPGFATSLTDDQISRILTYIRASWNNSASPVEAGVVSAERTKPGSPDDNYKNYPK
jgi:mono/diheme cytochrome c family protein